MKRKQHKGIFFFPMEVDHIINKRIRLLFNDHGSDGYWIWANIISKGYKTHGYYFHADEEGIDLLAVDCNKSPELCKEVILSCVKRGLFDELVYKKFNILTSDRMQINYIKATYDSRRKETIVFLSEQLFVIDENEMSFFTENQLINLVFEETQKNVFGQKQAKPISMEKHRISMENGHYSMDLPRKILGDSHKIHGNKRNFPAKNENENENENENDINTLSADADFDFKKSDVVGVAEMGVKGAADFVKKKGARPRKKKVESDPDKELFNHIKNSWMVWFKSRGNPSPKFEGPQAKATSNLRTYFLRLARDSGCDDEHTSAGLLFDDVLNNWEKLKANNFLYSAVDIMMISSKINEIINFQNNGQQRGNKKSGGTSGKSIYDSI